MDTFLIFLFVFGIAGWGIWRLYHAAHDTYGDNSPLKVERIYKMSTLKYFTNFEYITSYPLLGMACFILTVPIWKNVPPLTKNGWIFYLLSISVGISLGYMSLYLLIFQHNYWKFTQGIIITSNPSKQEIHLNIRGKEIILKNGDIEKILMVSNNSKLSFSYCTYYLKNGDKFILTDRIPGQWFIREYFKKIPLEHKIIFFPFIK